MPTNRVVFIDTSVLTNLLRVPGRSDRQAELQTKFTSLVDTGAKFVIPVTAVIETGNFVAQASQERREAATRFRNAISAAKQSSPPWTIRDVLWDDVFLDRLLDGSSTGTDLVDRFTNKTLGAGDLAIVVERDQFLAQTAYQDVRIWTLDGNLAAYSDPV